MSKPSKRWARRQIRRWREIFRREPPASERSKTWTSMATVERERAYETQTRRGER